MAITRANVEAILVKRSSKRMAFVGMEVTTAGANADLNDPISGALRQCGVTPANIASVADSDLAALETDLVDKLLDLAELRLLQSIYGNLDAVDTKSGPRSDSYSQFGDQLEKAIARLEGKVMSLYGVGAGSLETGVISLEFQQKDNADTLDE
jgi:hypothetical protein